MSSSVGGLQYRQVDVFSDGRNGGNGLAVFWDCHSLTTRTMQLLTIELRQFESIFLQKTDQPDQFSARVFTMEEELDFAGHPPMGAAAVLHEKYGNAGLQRWILHLNAGSVRIETTAIDRGFQVTMHQPKPAFPSADVVPVGRDTVSQWIGLGADDMDTTLSPEVVSTGLPYLIVPVRRNLSKARITVSDLEKQLEAIGAKFLYVYDTSASEGRTWDNRGTVEDIATGSAAGPVAAYLCKHGRLPLGEELTIRQGRFVGRPSLIKVKVTGLGTEIDGVEVSGAVTMVATGIFDQA